MECTECTEWTGVQRTEVGLGLSVEAVRVQAGSRGQWLTDIHQSHNTATKTTTTATQRQLSKLGSVASETNGALEAWTSVDLAHPLNAMYGVKYCAGSGCKSLMIKPWVLISLYKCCVQRNITIDLWHTNAILNNLQISKYF